MKLFLNFGFAWISVLLTDILSIICILKKVISQSKKIIYILVGFVAMGLGILGIILSVLPTTPFFTFNLSMLY